MDLRFVALSHMVKMWSNGFQKAQFLNVSLVHTRVFTFGMLEGKATHTFFSAYLTLV